MRVRWRSASLRRCSSTCACSSAPTEAVSCCSSTTSFLVAAARLLRRRARPPARGEQRRGLARGAGTRDALRLAQLFLGGRQPRDVVAVHLLRDVLERLHGLEARVALGEAEERELEQRDHRREPLGRRACRSSLRARAARSARRVGRPREARSPRASRRRPCAACASMRAKPGDSSARSANTPPLGDRAADRLRKLLERGLDGDALDRPVRHQRAFAQHAPAWRRGGRSRGAIHGPFRRAPRASATNAASRSVAALRACASEARVCGGMWSG